MKIIYGLLSMTLVALVLGTNGAYAQDGPPTFSPFEIYGCSFNDNNDMDDLMSVAGDWNEWADEMGVEGYTALVAVPFFHAADFPFDFLWMGAFADGASMGNGFHRWVNQSGDLPDQFADVAACPLHMGFAATTLKAPSGDGDGVDDGGRIITEFTNCTVRRGRSRGEAADAIREWIVYLTENGSISSHWLMVPGPGEAEDADYSFKWMRGHSSWVSVGREFDINVNDGGLARRGELLERVMRCDSPRIYNTTIVREASE